MPKKILLITNYKPGVGGISGQVELLHRRLKGFGYSVEIYNTLGSPLKRLLAFIQLLGKGQRYQIFHVHACSGWGGFFPAVVGGIIGRLGRKKILLTYHGGGAEQFIDRNPLITKYIMGLASQVIVLSGYLKKIFDDRYIPSIIIPNILEKKSYIGRARQGQNIKFISVRSLTSIYNIACIIRAFAIVQEKIPEASLELLGGGPDEQSLKKLTLDLGLKNVDFVGRVENADVDKYLARADVMLSAPTIDNMPVSILEGFRAGLVVVSSNVGGVPYMIEDGVSGLLFESGNSMDLSNKMLLIINDSKLAQRLTQNAQQALEKYSWEVVSNQILSLYNS